MSDDAAINGKWALVTGAGQGIGAATCRALHAAGARIIALDLHPDPLKNIESEVGATPIVASVTDEALPARLDSLMAELGCDIDILVNNAGIGRSHNAIETTDEEMRRFLEVNLLGTFRLSRWAAARMVASGRGGSIVNVASVFGLVGAEHSAAYSTSKAAIVGLTSQMATDFGPSRIRVNAVAPGLIETPLTADRIKSQPWRTKIMVDQAPLRRLGQPADVASAIRFLASESASFITGHTLPVDGGWIMGRYPIENPIRQ